MRVTTYDIMQRWFTDSQARLNDLATYNRQVSTGKQIEKPSDDPTGSNRILQINEVVQRNDTYLANIEQAINMNSSTETTMDDVYSRLVRVKELAVEASNDPSMAQTGVSDSITEELKGIKEALSGLALTRIQGKYIFNGTAGEAPPFYSNGGPYQGDSNMLRINLGSGQSVPLNLTGDRAFREVEVRSEFKVFADSSSTLNVDPLNPLKFSVSDGKISTDITLSNVDQATAVSQMNAAFQTSGANLTASVVDGRISIKLIRTEDGGEITVTPVSGDLEGTLGITSGVKNVFSMMDDLVNVMKTKGVDGVTSFLDRIDRLSDNVANQRGQYGSRARNLQFARDRIEKYNLTSTTLKESIEGADLTKAVMKLNNGEQAYQATLAAGSRIFNISILNYLR